MTLVCAGVPSPGCLLQAAPASGSGVHGHGEQQAACMAWHLAPGRGSRWYRPAQPMASLSLSKWRPSGLAEAGPAGSLGVAGRPQGSEDPQLLHLPFGIVKGSERLQYVWDGKEVQALDQDSLRIGADTPAGAARRWMLVMQDRLHKAFVPNRKDVTDDYWEWLHWRLVQRFFSSTLQNLSTQSMLMALGLGAKRTIAASAAINWLLKDGVGRIARMTVATNFCQSFDSDLKRIRYMTSVIFDVTIGCEFLTPFFPQHFLPLASIANVGKAIALAAFVAVHPVFQKELCKNGNLADLTAKNQAQNMVVDMASLAVSASIMFMIRGSERMRMMLPLCLYPVLAVADLYAIYHEIKAIELKTLNRERAEMVADRWLETGVIPSVSQISKEERILLPNNIQGGLLPLKITGVDSVIRDPRDVAQLLRRYSGEQYMMTLSHPEGQQWVGQPASSSSSGNSGSSSSQLSMWQKPELPAIHLCLNEDAETVDIFKAVLEASALRQILRKNLESKMSEQHHARPSSSASGVGQAATQPQHLDQLWSMAVPLTTEKEMSAWVQQAKAKANKSIKPFLKDLGQTGWKTKSILLSTSEKVRYVNM